MFDGSPSLRSTIRLGRLGDIESVLAPWRRADASPSSIESAADLRGLLDRGPEALPAGEAGCGIVESEEPSAMAFWSAAGYELQAGRSRCVKNLP